MSEFLVDEIKSAWAHISGGQSMDIVSTKSSLIMAWVDQLAPDALAFYKEKMAMDDNEIEATVTKSEGDGNHPSSHYLVVEDPQKPTTWHLRYKNTEGKVDSHLLGGAWAALHGGYRGNKYEGPDKEKALAKLKSAYKSAGMETPDDKKSKSESSKETNMDDDEMKKKHDEMNEDKKETPDAEKKENEADGQAEYAKMKADMTRLASDLEARNADLANEQTAKTTLQAKVTDLEARVTTLETALQSARGEVKAHKVGQLKAKLVGNVMEASEFETRQDELLALPETTIDLLVRAATAKQAPEDKSGTNRLMASEQPQTGRQKIVVG